MAPGVAVYNEEKQNKTQNTRSGTLLLYIIPHENSNCLLFILKKKAQLCTRSYTTRNQQTKPAYHTLRTVHEGVAWYTYGGRAVLKPNIASDT